MSRIKTEKLHDFLIEKEMRYNVRLTSYAHGELKRVFLADCIQREWNESKMVNHILELYYSVAENKPTLNELQMQHFRKILEERKREDQLRASAQMSLDLDNPIKDYIIDRIKLE